MDSGETDRCPDQPEEKTKGFPAVKWHQHSQMELTADMGGTPAARAPQVEIAAAKGDLRPSPLQHS